jgi:hypothetical protein
MKVFIMEIFYRTLSRCVACRGGGLGKNVRFGLADVQAHVDKIHR